MRGTPVITQLLPDTVDEAVGVPTSLCANEAYKDTKVHTVTLGKMTSEDCSSLPMKLPKHGTAQHSATKGFIGETFSGTV